MEVLNASILSIHGTCVTSELHVGNTTDRFSMFHFVPKFHLVVKQYKSLDSTTQARGIQMFALGTSVSRNHTSVFKETNSVSCERIFMKIFV